MTVQKTRRKRLSRTAVPLVLTLLTGGTMAVTTEIQPAASATTERGSKLYLTVDGEQFKDRNGNGQLDVYEDSRKPIDERVDDLVSQMTLEEKAGLMLIDTMNAACDPATGTRGVVPSTGADYIDTQNMRRFIVRNVVTSADKAVCGDPAAGGFAASTSVTPGEAAGYMNSVQEMAEDSRLGIPVLFKSNARNHIDPNARAGINEAAGAFTAFPKEAGLAAAALGEGDMSVIEDFAEVMGEEWKSIGLRGMYGYMADLSTEPRWYRAHETFTEDADLNSKITRSLVQTLQGPVNSEGVSLSPESSVALTMKHFPGGGPQELGFDPHYSFGKTQTYEGGGFDYALKPFEAAIEAGVSAIMPYYGVPMDLTRNGVTYDEVGMAFSDQIVNGLLRDELGFKGYVNSDTGIIEDRAWGLEEATIAERVAAAINGGTETLSGFHNVGVILDLVNTGLVTEARVTQAAERLLKPMFQMGLFEDPYVDEAAADATVGTAAHQAVALDIQHKSAVLLQNDPITASDPISERTLPLAEGSSVYLLGDIQPGVAESYGYDVIDGQSTDATGARPSAKDSDYVVISMTAKNVNTSTYDSTAAAQGDHVNPIVADGFAGLDGESAFGASDACVAYAAATCTDSRLNFGGSLPWETSILDFTGMSTSESWQVTPSLDTIQQVIDEVGDPSKVVLHVYFRQPFVLDEASGLRDAGAIVAGFGISDKALMDLLSGKVGSTEEDVDFSGKMPFALAGTRAAVEDQFSDLPGYEETADGALFPFGAGYSYANPEAVAPVDPGTPVNPGTPVVPGTPVDPGAPVVPGTPVDPAVPAEPAAPAGADTTAIAAADAKSRAANLPTTGVDISMTVVVMSLMAMLAGGGLLLAHRKRRQGELEPELKQEL